MCPHQIPQDHDFGKLFWANDFKNRYLKMFLYKVYFCVKKKLPPIVPHPNPRDHDFNKLASTLTQYM